MEEGVRMASIPETPAGDGNSLSILVPVRMLNEHVYCPRLAYLMWVRGEFAHNEFTVDTR
jgi:hypothetical protein